MYLGLQQLCLPHSLLFELVKRVGIKLQCWKLCGLLCGAPIAPIYVGLCYVFCTLTPSQGHCIAALAAIALCIFGNVFLLRSRPHSCHHQAGIAFTSYEGAKTPQSQDYSMMPQFIECSATAE